MFTRRSTGTCTDVQLLVHSEVATLAILSKSPIINPIRIR